MTLLLAAFGLILAATLACCGPRTTHGQQFDLAAGVMLVLSLAVAGLQLPMMA